MGRGRGRSRCAMIPVEMEMAPSLWASLFTQGATINEGPCIMQLTGDQLDAFHQALRSAFPIQESTQKSGGQSWGWHTDPGSSAPRFWGPSLPAGRPPTFECSQTAV